MKEFFSLFHIRLKYFIHPSLSFLIPFVSYLLTWCLSALPHQFSFSSLAFFFSFRCHVLINNQLELLRPSLKSLLFAIYYHPHHSMLLPLYVHNPSHHLAFSLMYYCYRYSSQLRLIREQMKKIPHLSLKLMLWIKKN